jgi:hypothetical protein
MGRRGRRLGKERVMLQTSVFTDLLALLLGLLTSENGDGTQAEGDNGPGIDPLG